MTWRSCKGFGLSHILLNFIYFNTLHRKTQMPHRFPGCSGKYIEKYLCCKQIDLLSPKDSGCSCRVLTSEELQMPFLSIVVIAVIRHSVGSVGLWKAPHIFGSSLVFVINFNLFDLILRPYRERWNQMDSSKSTALISKPTKNINTHTTPLLWSFFYKNVSVSCFINRSAVYP